MKNYIIRIVKMTAYYSLLGLMLQGLLVNLIFAITPAVGQNLRDVKLSVKAVDVTLEQALQLIEQKTNFKFTYSKDEIHLSEKATVVVDDESLYNILEVFAKDYGLTFNRINDQIVIKKSKGQVGELVTANENGTIKGRVFDGNTKEPLIGATVVLRGTTYGNYTDAKGYYEIDNVKPGKYTIAASYMGYSTTTKTIEVVSEKIAEVNLPLGQSVVNLDEVVVTGSLSERQMREVANPISVISSKEFENRNLTSFATVLESIPGIELSPAAETTTGSVYSSIYIRGGAPLSNVVPGSGVKFIVDGVEVADPSFLQNLNPNDIEKIEVGRGPMAATIYGAGSSGGVIQIFTKRGTMGNVRINLRTMFSSTDNKYLSSNPLSQNYTLSLSGGQGEFGYTFGIDNTRSAITQYIKNNGIDNVDWNLNSGVYARIQNLSADLKFQYSRNTYGSYAYSPYYYFASNENWKNPSSFLYYTDSKSTSDAVLASLNMKQILGVNWYHNLTIGYAKNGYETVNNSASQVGPTNFIYPTFSRDFRKYDVKYFMNLDQSLSTDFNMDVTGGFDYVDYQFVDELSTYSNVQKDYASQQEASFGFKSTYPTNTTGLFAEAVWGYQNNLFLTTGVRTEKNSGYGNDLGWYTMPRVGITYVQELGNFTFKPRASLGKSSEPANPYYKIGSISPGWRNYLPNQDLKPQQQSGYELGMDIYFSSIISFNITYYNQKISDLIVGVNLGTTTDNTPNYQYQNVAKADNKGWELSSKVSLQPFTLDLSFTSVKSIYSDGIYSASNPYYNPGNRIPNIPSGSFFAKLSYDIPVLLPWSSKGGNVSLEYRWNGDTFGLDGYSYYKDLNNGKPQNYYGYYKTLPGYAKINLRANYAVLNNISLFVDIYNLANNQDFIGGQAFMIGRSISFGFNFQY